MDGNKIAFITCVNDEGEYAECCHYLERLYVPEGYIVDRIGIQEAPSMAAGYNAGMNGSDARYKVYLHQDVRIKNRNFISDLLEVFARDEQIGMVGMVGRRNPWTDMDHLMMWDTGKVVDNCKIHSFEFPRKEDGFMEVQAADGLLLATQHDLLWREELFDGWHFYDFSQCMEFREKYKVIVPWQKEPWCYHDDSYIKLDSYYHYYERFLHEYGERDGFPVMDKKVDESLCKNAREVSQMQEDVRKTVEAFFYMGNKAALRSFFESPGIQGLQCLWEYNLIVEIDRQEEQCQSPVRFWEPEMTVSQLVSKVRKLKYALKRMEYGADTNGQESAMIKSRYSWCAIANTCKWYVK